MAKVKLGPTVATIAGSVDGTTYQTDRCGLRMISRQKKVNNRTINQQNYRSFFAQTSTQWRALSEADRIAWDLLAQELRAQPQFGTVRPISGQQAWMRLATIVNVPLSDRTSSAPFPGAATSGPANYLACAFIVTTPVWVGGIAWKRRVEATSGTSHLELVDHTSNLVLVSGPDLPSRPLGTVFEESFFWQQPILLIPGRVYGVADVRTVGSGNRTAYFTSVAYPPGTVAGPVTWTGRYAGTSLATSVYSAATQYATRVYWSTRALPRPLPPDEQPSILPVTASVSAAPEVLVSIGPQRPYHIVTVLATPPISPGIRNPKPGLFKRLIVRWWDATDLDLTAEYSAIFGPPRLAQVGQRVHFQVVSITPNGYDAKPVRVSIDVTP